MGLGDVLHRRSVYLKKLQAGFDPLSRFRQRRIGYLYPKNRVKQKHAKKSFGVDLTKVANAFTGALAPKAPVLAFVA